jgi:hypothetical protein
VNFLRFDDPKFGIIWLNWVVLWSLFWLVLGLGLAQLTTLTGWTTLVMSFTTCTIPAYLLLLGAWDDVPTWVYVAIAAATLVAVPTLARAAPPRRAAPAT